MKKFVNVLIVLILLVCSFYLWKSNFFFANDNEKGLNTEETKEISLQEQWEKYQWIWSAIFVGGTENTNELWKKVVDSKYSPKEYQRALFKNQSLYFHFVGWEIVENSQISLYVYTWTVNITFENLDNPEFVKTISFPASMDNKKEKFSFRDYEMLGVDQDIHTMKIWTDSDLAILDYEIKILEK